MMIFDFGRTYVEAGAEGGDDSSFEPPPSASGAPHSLSPPPSTEHP